MQFPKYLVLFGLLGVLGACTDSVVPFEPVALDVPAGSPAAGPRLSGGNGDPLILSWMEENEDGAALYFSSFDGESWPAPKQVVDGIDMFVNWADMPTVKSMRGDRLAAHWLQMSAELTYAYDVVFVQSTDGGATWSAPLRPHSDGTPTEHGFVSMFPWGEHTGLIWLDGRKMVKERTDNPADTGMTLRFATIDPDAGIHTEQLVDELICDCCQTDIALASSGPVAVYRDRSPAEIRDIYVTRFIDGQWQQGTPVASDNWRIPGCPVNGPSIAAEGSLVAVAWFTAADEQPTVKLSFSNDSGETFGDAIEVASGKVLGRVGLVNLGDGAVAISWLQTLADGSNAVLVQTYTVGSESGSPHTVAKNVSSFAVPQMALAGSDLVLVWTKTEVSGHSIHSAAVPLTALAAK